MRNITVDYLRKNKRTGSFEYRRRVPIREMEGAGMVLSIETQMQHPARGFIKLEDTLTVTETGFEMFGTEGRGWNRGGTG